MANRTDVEPVTISAFVSDPLVMSTKFADDLEHLDESSIVISLYLTR